jgi:hypothetical protein
MHVGRCDVQRNMGDGDAATSATSAMLSRLLPRWEFVEASLPYFGIAIEALEQLDRGNRVVERCVSYLLQLVLVPINPGQQAANESGLPPGGPQTGPAIAHDHYGHHSQAQGSSGYAQGYPSHHGHVHPHAHLHTVTMSSGAAGSNGGPGVALPRQPQQVLPMEIDLNEFMLDTDFDLLNMAWLSS